MKLLDIYLSCAYILVFSLLLEGFSALLRMYILPFEPSNRTELVICNMVSEPRFRVIHYPTVAAVPPGSRW